jgi:hypothetical protein
MRSALITAALLLSAGYALAQGNQNTMTSGRPHAVLNNQQCQEVWQKAAPSGDSLARADSGPFIVNFKQVDKDQDGTISNAEFQAACGKGMVKYTQR